MGDIRERLRKRAERLAVSLPHADAQAITPILDALQETHNEAVEAAADESDPLICTCGDRIRALRVDDA